MKIIEQIEVQRKIKGMNKQTLCTFAKINKNSYTNYLKGRSSPTVEVLERILNVLECKIIVVDKRV